VSLQPFAPAPSMSLQAATPFAGVALVNGTPVILTWTAPNDGRLHRHLILASEDVLSAMTGGYVSVSFTAPDGAVFTYTLFNGGVASTGFNGSLFTYPVIVRPGTNVTVNQSTALTAGSATLWAEIWGS
jgi:hypothetical protein